jgi:putative NIF3 family GTP cyclohydrolase 1 type 2
MLTIDLTERVLDEAMADPAVGVIVAYHPPLFRPVKCLTLSDIHQRIALKCCAAGISVFSPHTALDACQNGINDWLVSGLGSGTSTPIVPTMPGTNAVTGMGRLLKLTQPVSLDKLIDNVKKHLGLDKGT